MTVGLVDIGSNTIRLCIYQVDHANERLLISKKTVAGLAGFVDNKELTKKGISRLIDVLKQYQQIFKDLKVEQTVYFSTASLRNVSNQEKVLKKVKKELDIDIDVIDGEMEALYGLIGSKKSLTIEDGIYVDIGGGSTEIIYLKDNQVLHSISLPIGSLNLFKKHVTRLIPTIAEAKEIKRVVKAKLNQLDWGDIECSECIGVGGTIRAIRKFNIETSKVKIKQVNELDVSLLKDIASYLELEEATIIYGLATTVPDRIHTFIPGLLILIEITKKFNIKTIHVSDTGVREGYLVERIQPQLSDEIN